MFTTEDTSSLPVPYTIFQEAKSHYLGQLIVTPEIVAKTIKAMADNESPEMDGISPRLPMETVEQISIIATVLNLEWFLFLMERSKHRTIIYKGFEK